MRDKKHVVAVDFESYYDDEISISVQGMIGYIEHPEFNPYMVSIVGEDFAGRSIAFVGDPDEAPWERVDGITWVSHNMAFDAYIWRWMTSQKNRSWGEGPAEWNCTADLAVYCHGPRSLAGATKYLLPEVKGHGKSMRAWAKGKTPEEIKALGKWEEMSEYALLDSAECKKLWDKFEQYWPENERRLSRLTAEWGWKGVAMDCDNLKEAIADLEEQLLDARALIPWSGEKPPTSQLALINYCQEQGIPAPPSTAMDHPDSIAWEAEHGEAHSCVLGMREYRRVNKMLMLLKALKNLTRPTGTMPYAIKYFGAHTGRWSGGAERDNTDIPKSINMQNIYAKNLFGWTIREMFIPRPGHKMVICDLSQIEPRCLAWITGQQKLLDLVAGGMSPYEAHARVTMGYKSEAPLKSEDPAMYSLAKARVLALGYGAGAAKFQIMAANYGVTIGEAEAKQVVNDFRNQNPEIVQFWKALDRTFRTAVNDREPLELSLPSGRDLLYLNPRNKRVVGRGVQPVAQTALGGGAQSFYGGKLCENVVQAVARDVFAQLLLDVYDYLTAMFPGMARVLWHVHDEVIVEVVEEHAKEAKQGIEMVMSSEVSWMPGCPIAAEAEITSHYKK